MEAIKNGGYSQPSAYAPISFLEALYRAHKALRSKYTLREISEVIGQSRMMVKVYEIRMERDIGSGQRRVRLERWHKRLALTIAAMNAQP